MEGDGLNAPYKRYFQEIPLSSLLDESHNSPVDNATTRVAWIFSCKMNIRVKSFRLSC